MTSHEQLVISTSGFHISLDHQFLGASSNALVECKCCGNGMVEIKCPYNCCNKTLEDVSCEGKYFSLEKLSNGTLKLKCDYSYYLQCQMQMFSTRRVFCDIVVWSSNELHVERLTLD